MQAVTRAVRWWSMHRAVKGEEVACAGGQSNAADGEGARKRRGKEMVRFR
jgi:hypothetical protein